MGKAILASAASASVAVAKMAWSRSGGRGDRTGTAVGTGRTAGRAGSGSTTTGGRRCTLFLSLMLTALLLLAAPVLANAWTLTVKVTGPGGVPDNKVVVSGGATRTVTSGTVTMYPSGAATATVYTAAGYTRSVTVDGIASALSAFTFSSGTHNVTVAYSAPTTNNVTITQNTGGTVYLQLPNSTWSSTGATGVAPGTSLPISIAANGDHTIRNYTVNGVTTTVNGTVPGQVLNIPFIVTSTPAPNTITASYGFVPTVSATLSVPANGYNTQTINCSADATSNDSGLLYSFSVISKPSGAAAIAPQGPGTLKSYSFVPDLLGTYRVQVSVSSAGGGFAQATADVVVSSYLDYRNSQCTSCHTTSYPQVVAAYNAGSHPARQVGCQDCHSGGAPHSDGVNRDNVSSTTFTVTGVVTGHPTGSLFCMTAGCHTPGVVHKSPGMLCAACHNSGELHNPDASFAQAANICFDCHGAVNGTHFYTKTSLGVSQCALCHPASGHNPVPATVVARAHFNGYTSYANPGYAAAYVTPATVCADCHQGGDPASAADTALQAYRSQWAGSAHGDAQGAAWLNTASHNWKGSGKAGADAKASAGIAVDCQRCHTALGYLQFAQYTSYAPVAGTTERYSEPLTCNACHVSGDFSASRSIGARTGYYNYSSAATGRLRVALPYPDSGKSNICLGCHVGREAGATIKAIAQATAHKSYSSSFWQDTGFINSHYLAAGGQVFGVTGFEYPGQQYESGGVDHSRVGADSAQGPCVACHMPGSSHTLEASAAGYALCNGCHTGAGVVNAGFIADKDAAFRAALKALASALASRGFAPNLDADGVIQYPYFTARNWGGEESAPGNMGAAFNYNLLAHDPGAFAHNPTYTKRLLRDSIDYLSFGSVERGRDLTATMAALLPDNAEQARAAAFFQNAGEGTAACIVCHSESVDPLSGGNILAMYASTEHALNAGGASCLSCHAPDTDTAHPHQAMLSTQAQVSERCFGCHAAHSFPSIGRCMNCHNPHDPKQVHIGFPHYNNFSTAQYVTKNLSCNNCHTTVDVLGDATFNIYSANLQWGRSGKGNIVSPSWTGRDFKTLGSPAPVTPANSAAVDCVRCHTTTGYINYVSSNFQDISAWGSSGLIPGGDRTREMVACSACHAPTPFLSYYQYDWDTDIETPPFSRRVVPQVTVYYNFSTAGAPRILNPVTLPANAGQSNNCIVCHSGTVAGSTLKALAQQVTAADPFWNSTPFIDPHGMAAAGILYGISGYGFAGASYSGPINYVHWAIGGNDAGPCVACHMSTPKPHLFSAVSSASNGVIGKISAFEEVCSGCHSGGSRNLNEASLNADKEAFASSLKALAAALAVRGIHFNPAREPYFFTVADGEQQNPGTAYLGWGADYLPGPPPVYRGQDVMGAAFNLKLLWSERGAYAHNDYYARRLIYDSIDLVDNGRINGSVFVTLQDLATGSDFTETDKVNARNYIGTRP